MSFRHRITANGNGGTVPDIHGKATVEALAITTIAIYIASLFGLTVPGEVAAAGTTLIGVGVGVIKGSKFNHSRRLTDPHK